MANPLKLFYVTPKKFLDRWDVYEGCVVWAETAEDAILYHPDGIYKWDVKKKAWISDSGHARNNDRYDRSWIVGAPTMDKFDVREETPTRKGVVLSSYHAG